MFLALGPATLTTDAFEPLVALKLRACIHPSLVRVVIVETVLRDGSAGHLSSLGALWLETASCPPFDMNGCVTESATPDAAGHIHWRFSGYASDPLVSVLRQFASMPPSFAADLQGDAADHAVLRDWCLQQGQGALIDWLSEGPDAPGGWQRGIGAEPDQDR